MVYKIKHVVKSVYQKINFLKVYVVGTQKNSLNERFRLSNQKHMLKLMGKKILTILHSKILFI